MNISISNVQCQIELWRRRCLFVFILQWKLIAFEFIVDTCLDWNWQLRNIVRTSTSMQDLPIQWNSFQSSMYSLYLSNTERQSSVNRNVLVNKLLTAFDNIVGAPLCISLSTIVSQHQIMVKRFETNINLDKNL